MPGESGAGDEEAALAPGDDDHIAAQIEFHFRGAQAYQGGAAGGYCFECQVARQGLAHDVQGHLVAADPHERAGLNIQGYRIFINCHRFGNRDARGVHREEEVSAEVHSGQVNVQRGADLAGESGVCQQEGALAFSDAHQIARTVAQRQRNVLRSHENRKSAVGGGRLLEGKIAAEGLPQYRDLQVDRLEAGDVVCGIETHDNVFVGAADGQDAVDRLAGVVEAYKRRAAEGHAVDTQHLDRPAGAQCVSAAEPDQADRRVGKQHAGGQRVDLAAFEAGRALSEEYFQFITGENALPAALGEAYIALYRDEVADLQRQVGYGYREDISLEFVIAEADCNAAPGKCDRFVDGSAGRVDSQRYRTACGNRAGFRGRDA